MKTEKPLSSMQLKFLQFSVGRTVYGFNGNANPALPVKGAVAKTLINSLRRRGFINKEGIITVAGRTALEGQRVTAETLSPPF